MEDRTEYGERRDGSVPGCLSVIRAPELKREPAGYKLTRMGSIEHSADAPEQSSTKQRGDFLDKGCPIKNARYELLCVVLLDMSADSRHSRC